MLVQLYLTHSLTCATIFKVYGGGLEGGYTIVYIYMYKIIKIILAVLDEFNKDYASSSLERKLILACLAVIAFTLVCLLVLLCIYIILKLFERILALLRKLIISFWLTISFIFKLIVAPFRIIYVFFFKKRQPPGKKKIETNVFH